MAQWLHAGTLKTEARFGVCFCWADLGKFHTSIGLSFPCCKMGVRYNSQNCNKEKIHVNTWHNVTYIGIVQQMGESSYMWKSVQPQVLLEGVFFLFLFFFLQYYQSRHFPRLLTVDRALLPSFGGFSPPNSSCSPFPMPARADLSANFTHFRELGNRKFLLPFC